MSFWQTVGAVVLGVVITEVGGAVAALILVVVKALLKPKKAPPATPAEAVREILTKEFRPGGRR